MLRVSQHASTIIPTPADRAPVGDPSSGCATHRRRRGGQIVSIDDVTKAVDILAKLLGVIVWPSIIIFILFRFGRSIGDVISSLTEFSVKGAGFEASGKRKIEAAAALGAAIAK